MSLDFADIIGELRAQGWTVEQLNGSHFQARPPDLSLPVVHFANSSGDRRAIRNTLAQLRKSGFRWGDDREDAAPPSGPTCSTCGGTRAIAGRGIRIACPECVVLTPNGAIAPPAVNQPPLVVSSFDPRPRRDETDEDPLDAAYRELREARSYLNLADEHASETAAALEEAQKRKADADAEWSAALEAFERCETRFLSALRHKPNEGST